MSNSKGKPNEHSLTKVKEELMPLDWDEFEGYFADDDGTENLDIEIPDKLIPVFAPPRGSVRYRGAYGGRGSAKSASFALMAAIWAATWNIRVLCAREFQASIKESFYAEVKLAIERVPWLAARYDIGEKYIRCLTTGSEFLFAGLRHNIQSVKSMSKIDLCIVEESEDVPLHSWVDLIPTIREPDSEIWLIWNPKKADSYVAKRFYHNQLENAVMAELNWRDNPWFPKVLEDERRTDEANMERALYEWIWEGKLLQNSKAQILADKLVVKEVTPQPHWHGPYHGLDFGFSQDPTAAVRCWVYDSVLYVEREATAVGLDIDETAAFILNRIPEFDLEVIRADNSRPESISYLKKRDLQGLRPNLPRITACKKGAGSVEDGVMFLRSFRSIQVDPSCTRTIRECSLYSYKTDRLSGDVLSDIIDKNNDCIDAIRYAVEPLIKTGKSAGSL